VAQSNRPADARIDKNRHVHAHRIGVINDQGIGTMGLNTAAQLHQNGVGAQSAKNPTRPCGIRNGKVQAIFSWYLKVQQGRSKTTDLYHDDDHIGPLKGLRQFGRGFNGRLGTDSSGHTASPRLRRR